LLMPGMVVEPCRDGNPNRCSRYARPSLSEPVALGLSRLRSGEQ